MFLQLLLCMYALPTLPKSVEKFPAMSPADSSTSKLIRYGNAVSWSLMGVSILAGIMGLTPDNHLVFSKIKKLLGWKPKPLNVPANVVVQTGSTSSNTGPVQTTIKPSNLPANAIAQTGSTSSNTGPAQTVTQGVPL
eukprot:NODE_84_length_22349_cov_0.357888.p13 type:complete len:137 gc:universal NODE_84_length_22349_cov_0.357888:14566-14156(-)